MKISHIVAAAMAMSGALHSSAHAAPWSRGYAVEWIEAASHFGGTGQLTEPGSDCPQGTETIDLNKLLLTAYRDSEQVAKALDPDQRAGQGEGLFQAMTIRGLNKENIYKNLKAAPDPGMRAVQSKIAEGFDLDRDPRTGLPSATGEKGIDNEFYRAWGCWEAFRGPPRKSSGAIYHNDEMRNGKFTVLILISGNQDPQNDEDVSIGFYATKDKLVKDANGDIAPHYSYRIADDPPHTSVLKGRVKDGVVELLKPQDIHAREASFLANLTLYDARVRLKMKPDGGLEGMLGGYKPIEEAITTWTIAGPNVELVTHVNLSAAYYAIERHADARPDPKTGRNTAISTALRLWAVPAFVIKPDASGVAEAAQPYPPATGGTP